MPTAPTTAPPPPPVAGRLFVTNENGGDISVVDVAAQKVVATIPVGKRPRGIRLSPDGTQLFVALSGSPIAPPGVDESTLPPADKKADGIGVVSVKDLKLERVIRGGSDPEQTRREQRRHALFVANEDIGESPSSPSTTARCWRRSRSAASPKAWSSGPTAASST